MAEEPGWGPPATGTTQVAPPAETGWGPEPQQELKPEPGWGPPAEQPAMPGIFEAAGEGLVSGFKGLKQTKESFSDPKNLTPEKESPAASPLEWGDLASPVSKLMPKLGFATAKSWPTIGMGIAGAGAGALTPIPGGTLAGGAAGATIGTVAQTLGPVFAEELKKSPKDPDGAWDRALQQSAISGTFSGAGWAAFPIRAFQGPVKQLLFQAFGVQPGISVAERATQNVVAGKDVTEGLGEAYTHGAIGTAVPAIGQYAAGKLYKGAKTAVARTPEEQAVLDRIGKEDNSTLPASGAELSDSLNRVYTNVKDDLNPIKQARDILTDGQTLPADADPYIISRLTRGSTGKGQHFIEHGTFDPKTLQDTGPALTKILEPVQNDMDGFRAYAISKRALELDQRGVMTAIPGGDARANVASGHQKYEPIFRQFVKYNDDVLNYLVESGVISKDAAAVIRDMNKDYVPFYRLIEGDNRLFGIGPGLKTRNPIFRIKGSEKPLIDPIETTMRNTFSFISLADRNIALRALEDLANSSPRGRDILEPVSKTKPITISRDEIERALNGQGITTSGAPDPITIFRKNAHNPRADEIVIFNDGKAHTYKVDPYLARAVNNLDREGLNLFTKMFAIPARTMRAGITLSAEYMARNLGRDQMSAFILSSMGKGHRRGYVPFYEAMQGAGEVLHNKEAYRNWLKSGGAGATLASIDQNYINKIVAARANPGLLNQVGNVITSPLQGLRAFGELVENATRVGEYKRLIESGMGKHEAAYSAREITLDFQRMGAKMRGANAIIPFLNAHMEGLDRTGRALWNNPLGFTAKAMAAITLPSMYLWFANKDDPRYQEIPRWQKDLFWLIMTDNWQPVTEQQAKSFPKGYTRQRDGQWEVNKGNIWRIPKPFEMGVIFGSVPERLMDAFYAKNPDAFKGIGSTLKNIFLPNYVPQAVSPAIEHLANQSLFTGRPLIPQYLEGLIPKEQYNPYTTETAKLAGRAMSNIPGMDRASITSPIIIQNYVRAYTGGIGMYVMEMSDWALKQSGATPNKVLPALTNADKTLLKAFSVRFPEAGANSIQDFYEEANKRAQTKKTVSHLKKTYQGDSASDLAREENLAVADSIKKAIGVQMKLVRDAYIKPDWSREKKREFIDASYLQAIRMAQQGNEMLKKTEVDFAAKKAVRKRDEAGWGPAGRP